MKTEKIVLNKDLVKRKKFLKTEFKKKIFKSVSQNFQINNLIRMEMIKKIIFLKKSESISKQNNICVITGRFGGIFKKYTLSRHMIKNMAKYNMLHNTTIKSW
jgi:ribosomal protein S14